MVFSVLIVEDDPMVLSINKRYVEKVPGFQVHATAKSTREALLLTNKYRFDLLLVDIHLENETGVDLIKSLRKKEYVADFIMITAASEQKTIALCSQYGAVDYILKPFQFDRFKKSLLRFKFQKELLDKKTAVTQNEIDQYYWTNDQIIPEDYLGLEKGLTKESLQLILSVIDRFDDGFTVEDLTSKTHLSHVSVRKYVRYLEEQGILDAKQKYGSVGRPTMYYFMN